MRPERPSPPLDPEARQRDQLATFLVVMLTLVFGGSFVIFLIFVSLGLFLWVIVTAAGIAAFTGFHYLLWGRLLTPPTSAIDAESRDAPTTPPESQLDLHATPHENQQH